MEPLLVYGVPLGSSMGLVAALEWLGQPYRLSRVDMLSEMKNASYARINGRLETPVPCGLRRETKSGASVFTRTRRKPTACIS